jgi:hypothetical protein
MLCLAASKATFLSQPIAEATVRVTARATRHRQFVLIRDSVNESLLLAVSIPSHVRLREHFSDIGSWIAPLR